MMGLMPGMSQFKGGWRVPEPVAQMKQIMSARSDSSAERKKSEIMNAARGTRIAAGAESQSSIDYGILRN